MPPKYRKFPPEPGCLDILVALCILYVVIGWAVVHFFF